VAKLSKIELTRSRSSILFFTVNLTSAFFIWRRG